MRSFVALCVVLAVSVSISSAIDCEAFMVSEDDPTIYSFCHLYQAVNTYTYVGKTLNRTLAFSMAQTTPDCNNNASNPMLATSTLSSTGNCTNANVVSPTVNYRDETDPTAGLIFTYLTPDAFNVTAVLICDNDGDMKTAFDNITYDVASKTYTLTVTSSNSCPNAVFSKLAYYASKYPAVFVALGVILGLFICFFGLPMLKYTIFLIGALLGTFISATLFTSLLDYNAKPVTFWLVIAVCVVIGCVLGWIAVKIETLGFVVLGGALGVIGGQLLFTAAFAPMGAKVAVYWVTIIVCAFVGAGLAYKFWKSVVIIATAILGSSFVVRALSYYIGGFPSADTLSRGGKFTPAVYGYIVAIALLAIAGMYVQHKRKKAAEVEEDADVHGYQKVMAGYNA